MLSFRMLSSQIKVFPDSELPECRALSASALQNEPFSFQIAYRTDVPCASVPVSVRVLGVPKPVDPADAGRVLSCFKVGFAAVAHAHLKPTDEGFLRTTPGLYPDLLLRRKPFPKLIRRENHNAPYLEAGEKNLLNASDDCWQSVYLTVNEDGVALVPGEYRLTVQLIDLADASVAVEGVLTLTILPASLPAQTALYTNWFHYDCLADIYGERVFTKRYNRILAGFLKNAARHGMNLLILPVYTPPFDTIIGEERKTVQLLGITVREDGGYDFDFSRVRAFTKLALSCGITNFEHPPLFTQWGAHHAPKIVGKRKGRTVRLFGWETDATSPEYKAFLTAYLTAFRRFAAGEGLSERMFFHISDEPCKTEEASYGAAVAVVRELLAGFRCGDALSDYLFYENGMVQTPVVYVPQAGDFRDRCENFWLYYIGSAPNRCTNRLLPCTASRTRKIGLELYLYRASGLLHWGYNYYYDRMSQGLFNPCQDAGGYQNTPGTCFLVYPAPDGTPIPSLREALLAEAMCDLRALRYLETLTDRERVLTLIRDFFGGEPDVFTLPESEDTLPAFREAVNRAIAAAL